MKISLFTTDASCADIGTFRCSHIVMFDKDSSLKICFTIKEEQLKFIKTCIEKYILIKVQGHDVTLLLEKDGFQRVRFRFDS